MKKILSVIAMSTLLICSVSEAKKNRKVASTNEHPVYCGKLSLGSSGHGNLTTYTLVDEPKSGKAKFYNPEILQDVEIGLDFAPAPGDSDPNGDNYRDHNVMIGKEKVWMTYAGGFFDDSALTHGKCMCITGEIEKRAGAYVVSNFVGYVVRDQAKCSGIDDKAVEKFSRHRD